MSAANSLAQAPSRCTKMDASSVTMFVLVFVGALVLWLAVVYCADNVEKWYKKERYHSSCELVEEMAKESLEESNRRALPLDSDFERIYAFAVEFATNKFPRYRVTGRRIQDGKGYGVFVSDGMYEMCLQVRSSLTINGKEVANDILLHSDPLRALAEGCEAMSKNLATRKRTSVAGFA